jgi:hypothetical protein
MEILFIVCNNNSPSQIHKREQKFIYLFIVFFFKPAPTSSTPWKMNGKWSGNSFLLGSSFSSSSRPLIGSLLWRKKNVKKSIQFFKMLSENRNQHISKNEKWKIKNKKCENSPTRGSNQHLKEEMFTKNFHLLLVYLQIHSGLRPKKGWMGTICSHGCIPYFGSLFARICSVFLLGGVFGVLPSVRGCIA